MIKYNSKMALEKQILIGMVVLLSAIGIFSSCNSDVPAANRFTFTGKMMGQYLRDSTDFSEFTALLDTTKVMGLLNSYGAYTCFAPSNEAMKKFYKLKGKTSLKGFTLDTLKTIAYDHIINGNVVMYSNFLAGRLPELSMSDRYFSISFSTTGAAYINNTSLITQKDILVHNGVIHKINEVLNPTHSGIVEAISNDTTFSLFYGALIATGLSDSLLAYKDLKYDPTAYNYLNGAGDGNEFDITVCPSSRKYGFTALMESNATMRANGITDLNSMEKYAAANVYYDPNDPSVKDVPDIKNRNNSLNKFIAYHLINKQLSYHTFIDAYDVNNMLKNRDMYEYIEPMCPNTLMEIKKSRLLNKTNLINYITETGSVINIVTSNDDKDATNGVYHEIDGMLVYNKAVNAELSSKRLRFEPSSFFPEFTNNNMRGLPMHGLNNDKNTRFLLPPGYCDRIECAPSTNIGYLTNQDMYCDYEGDEFFIQTNSGTLYDFSFILPPVPAGTYELRFGYQANGGRGVAQMYIDDVPCDVPLDMNMAGKDVNLGWELPGSNADDPSGFLNDKNLRNKGFMKAPAVYHANSTIWFTSDNARDEASAVRRILGIYTFNTASTHKMTVRGLSQGQFMMDYFEYVPTSAIESEDIY